MKMGLVGLGKMGANMAKRLVQRNHEVVGYDVKKENIQAAKKSGAQGAGSLAELVENLEKPRAVWVMVPHGNPTRETIQSLMQLLESGDLIIDGGNSHYVESVENAARCGEHGIDFLDIGVSGGIWGLEIGYCMMAGGPRSAFDRIEPILKALAPEGGYAHFGKSGAGHFVKMIHNAIEYASLQAIGEGFECLSRSPFDIDLGKAAALWQHGSVIRSWLLELAERLFAEEGNDLQKIAPFIADSGTGRWSAEYALQQGIPLPCITGALFERFDSQLDERFAYKVIAGLRNQFGGHAEHRH